MTSISSVMRWIQLVDLGHIESDAKWDDALCYLSQCNTVMHSGMLDRNDNMLMHRRKQQELWDVGV